MADSHLDQNHVTRTEIVRTEGMDGYDTLIRDPSAPGRMRLETDVVAEALARHRAEYQARHQAGHQFRHHGPSAIGEVLKHPHHYTNPYHLGQVPSSPLPDSNEARVNGSHHARGDVRHAAMEYSQIRNPDGTMRRLPIVFWDESCPITPRQLQIIALAAEGASNEEIGADIGVSGETVRSHFGRIYRGLPARSRAHAAVICLRAGWIK